MEEEVVRVRVPRGSEIIGTVTEALGGSRFRVESEDGKERICRIPGKLKRRMYIRLGDVILLKPWELEGDKKGDILWRYRPTQITWLRNRGIMKQ